MSEEISGTEEDSNVDDESEDSSEVDSDSSEYYDYDVMEENTEEEAEPETIIDVSPKLEVVSRSVCIKLNYFVFIFISFVFVLR